MGQFFCGESEYTVSQDQDVSFCVARSYAANRLQKERLVAFLQNQLANGQVVRHFRVKSELARESRGIDVRKPN
jgi:hypothetical protein